MRLIKPIYLFSQSLANLRRVLFSWGLWNLFHNKRCSSKLHVKVAIFRPTEHLNCSKFHTHFSKNLRCNLIHFQSFSPYPLQIFKQRCHTQQCDINPKVDYLKFSNFKLQKATKEIMAAIYYQILWNVEKSRLSVTFQVEGKLD